MDKWWDFHPIITPLPRGFMDDDDSHKEAKEWMNRATDEIESLRAREERLREALQWYIDNDETNEMDEENAFWIAGRERARAALAEKEKK